MQQDRYSARIGESNCIAEDLRYDELVKRIMEFTIRAAVARSTDESDWEHEELRRRGLASVQLFQNGRAIWGNSTDFGMELGEARRERVATRFLKENRLAPSLYERLDRDLQSHWHRAGYQVPSLSQDMKKLFVELERDIAARAATAREGLLAEILPAICDL